MKQVLLTLYKVNFPNNTSTADIHIAADLLAKVVCGPFQLFTGVMLDIQTESGIGHTLALASHDIPPGVYLQIEVPVDDTCSLSTAKMRSSVIVTTCDLHFKGFIADKIFQGVPCSEETITWCSETTKIIGQLAKPSLTDIQQVISGLLAPGSDLVSMYYDQRFTLASCWFRRALEAANHADKFLFFYTVLEIYPACDSSDVPNRVRDFLVAHYFPHTNPDVVKERLMIGRIAGFRAKIVHDGLYSIEMNKEFLGLLSRLEALCRAVLLQLSGAPDSSDIAGWVLEKKP